MAFYDSLVAQTSAERSFLLSAPALQETLSGQVTLTRYQAFLTQAYHHVKHTVPLLMATGSRLPSELEWMRKATIEYINEEYGHERWILNDLRASGADITQLAPANWATQAMVHSVYDRIQQLHPAAFFGMAHVLEGTSIALATQAAEKIKSALQLPNSAFSYLLSHGDLDLDHVAFFKDLMNQLTDVEAQAAIVDTAKLVYRLYGEMFRALPSLAE